MVRFNGVQSVQPIVSGTARDRSDDSRNRQAWTTQQKTSSHGDKLDVSCKYQRSDRGTRRAATSTGKREPPDKLATPTSASLRR